MIARAPVGRMRLCPKGDDAARSDRLQLYESGAAGRVNARVSLDDFAVAPFRSKHHRHHVATLERSIVGERTLVLIVA